MFQRTALALALSLALFLAASHAQAQTAKAEEMGTAEQRAACRHDVGRFCKSVKAEDGPYAYLYCLQKYREKIRSACLRVIEGGF